VTKDGTRALVEAAFADEGLAPHTWSNEPGYAYGEHHHPYHKVLFCIAGSITFHTAQGDIALEPGARLDLPPGTTHSATVGPSGVTCMEAVRN
jgi:quercetin dioxygenase-like cupin family protein